MQVHNITKTGITLLGKTALSAILSISLLSGCSSAVDAASEFVAPEDPNVVMVQESYVKACPTATLGQMANSFFDSPTWESFIADSGETVVELNGGMTYSGVPADAKLQFTVTDLGTSFEASYFSINGEGQGILVISALLGKMCESA